MRTWMMAASVAAVGLMAAGTAEAALFDFSKLKESNENGGSDPNDINNQNGPFEFTAFGVTVTVTASGGSDFVGVLDTTAGSAGTENDPDLTSPFDDVDDGDDVVDTAFGNALIVQESGSGVPDDNARGGTLSFSFSRAMSFDYVDLLDIEETTTIKLFDAGDAELASLSGEVVNNGLPNNGPNQWKRFDFDTGGVFKMTVDFGGSGAVGQFAAAVALPPAALALAFGLGGLGYAARRQRRSKAA